MWMLLNESQRPSKIIESTIVASPMRSPSRTFGIRYGQLLIDSMPPATATSRSPVAMPCAASITALRPDPQTLLMVSAATAFGNPPRSAACRAGACPTPALTTLPMMHSSTTAASMPARRTASRTTRAPRSGALKSFRPPRNFPVGVRTALTITASRMSLLGIARGCILDDNLADHIGAEKLPQALGDHRSRMSDFTLPGCAPRADAQRPVFGPRTVGDAAERRARGHLPRKHDLRRSR